MHYGIEEITESFFRTVPYSGCMRKAKESIAQALTQEYEKALECGNEIQALGHVMARFGTLEEAAKLAGYSPEEISAWQNTPSVGASELKKQFKRVRRTIYYIALLFGICILYTAELFAWQNPWFLLFIAPCAAIGFAVIRKYHGGLKQCSVESAAYSPEAFADLRTLSDRYGKRLLNGLALSVCALTVLILTVAVQAAHMKAQEAVQLLFSYASVMLALAYLCIKNFLCKQWADHAVFGKIRENYKKQLLIVASSSVLYWAAVAAAVAVLKNRSCYENNIILLAAVPFLTALLVYDLTLRKQVVFKNLTVNKRRLTAFILAGALLFTYQAMRGESWLIQPYISTIPAVPSRNNGIDYDADSGIYTITSEKDDFRILQLTDIHLGGSVISAQKDLKALNAVYELIAHTEPDLVIVTGDLVFPMGIFSFSMNNYTPVMQFASFMRNIGIPWAFVYGNHDTEGMATHSAEDLNGLLKSVSFKSTGNFLYPYIQPDITGRNNQIIEIRNLDGSLNQALFLLDSNDYTGYGINDYDYIHDDQVDWYAKNVQRLNRQEGKTVSSMAFFHIPLQEYRDAYEHYVLDDGEVTYFFGENGETMIDKVCCSDYPSKLFDTAVMLGSTKAMFCGHDHYNNLSVSYRGIRLTYGMSIDYLAMPGIDKDTAQRGGTLITLLPDSEFEIEQIRLTDIT